MSPSCAATVYYWHDIASCFRPFEHRVFTTVQPSCAATMYYWHDIFLLVSSLWAQGIHYSSACRSLAFMTCSSLVPSWAKDLHCSSGCGRLLPLDCIACGLISACCEQTANKTSIVSRAWPIRSSSFHLEHSRPSKQFSVRGLVSAACFAALMGSGLSAESVSYTHLTLPTMAVV